MQRGHRWYPLTFKRTMTPMRGESRVKLRAQRENRSKIFIVTLLYELYVWGRK